MVNNTLFNNAKENKPQCTFNLSTNGRIYE